MTRRKPVRISWICLTSRVIFRAWLQKARPEGQGSLLQFCTFCVLSDVLIFAGKLFEGQTSPHGLKSLRFSFNRGFVLTSLNKAIRLWFQFNWFLLCKAPPPLRSGGESY